MTQYAVKYGDRLVIDHSWACVADVLATFHGGFCDQRGMVTGALVTRDGDGDEWVEIPDVWAIERADVLARFTTELKRATGDGSKKRRAGTKPPWHQDTSHEGAIFSHLTKWKRGETVDPDSGAHPLVHVAWRALAIACQESGNVPDVDGT